MSVISFLLPLSICFTSAFTLYMLHYKLRPKHVGCTMSGLGALCKLYISPYKYNLFLQAAASNKTMSIKMIADVTRGHHLCILEFDR